MVAFCIGEEEVGLLVVLGHGLFLEYIKNPGFSRKMLKILSMSENDANFALKKMDKNRVITVLEDEQLLQKFGKTLIREINDDDEPLVKVARQLLLLCLRDKEADDFFIAISGWNIDSLLKKTGV